MRERENVIEIRREVRALKKREKKREDRRRRRLEEVFLT